MNRGVTIVLITVVIAAALFAGYISNRSPYFDPELYSGSYPCSLAENEPAGPLDPTIEDWFAAPLRATDEPSLFFEKPPENTTTLRLTLLPAFVEPVIVRIDDLYGERPRLTATRARGQVVLQEGPHRLTRDLSPTEVQPIIAYLASSRVLDLPPDSCLSGVDGAIFLIEANGPDGYRFVNRWGVTEGSVYELGNLMFRLTGWPNGEQGPDRGPEAMERARVPRL